jgi:hypothetical protein
LPKHKVHRLSDASARFERGAITVHVGPTILTMSADQARRLAACLAAAIADARWARRPRRSENLNG